LLQKAERTQPDEQHQDQELFPRCHLRGAHTGADPTKRDFFPILHTLVRFSHKHV
jgi:hypothetical protein